MIGNAEHIPNNQQQPASQEHAPAEPQAPAPIAQTYVDVTEQEQLPPPIPEPEVLPERNLLQRMGNKAIKNFRHLRRIVRIR